MIQKIDFFAKWPHYIDHMAPIYHALGDSAGDFFMPGNLLQHIETKHSNIKPFLLSGNIYPQVFSGDNPILVAGHADLQTVYMNNPHKPIILMEHGVGLVFPNNPSYAGSIGYRKHAALTLAPNSIVYKLTQHAIPQAKQLVIGTPKLDPYVNWFPNWRQRRRSKLENDFGPKIAFGFHWDGGNVAPETGSAFDHFKNSLLLFKNSSARIIGHCHPRAANKIVPFYKQNNIRYEPDFDVVMQEADVYINDASSTLYEFLVTGKPVIIMNSPKYRRDVNFGIRFWEFTDIGDQVNNEHQLITAIEQALNEPDKYMEERRRTIDVLYPLLGRSAEYAASAIMEFFNG